MFDDKKMFEPVEIGKGVFWTGFYDKAADLHCNPYLIVEGDEAVLIDGGSRPDFPGVMMKIMKTGIIPENIKALIYQHYDPDLCGSLPHLESIIDSPGLRILTNTENIRFIRHYGGSTPVQSLDTIGYKFSFKSGRTLEFFNTPYAHTQGSFITFDHDTGILFTSDLFGSYSNNWQLFLKLEEKCLDCSLEGKCPSGLSICPVKSVCQFHKGLMTSERALKYAMEVISSIPFEKIAPQHGSILEDLETIVCIVKHLKNLKDVGVDAYLKGLSYDKIGNINPLLKRLELKGRHIG
ncbi:MAG: MBL fold metallo-hydrolase [Desulfobacteraceae bacterium]|nr:MBL fold metallo-hydrolase [Desulfobacteraceae bacterium]MCB9494199.1 MBL fold metallo-hydrolase [Desulfobacteraceae bacterium]